MQINCVTLPILPTVTYTAVSSVFEVHDCLRSSLTLPRAWSFLKLPLDRSSHGLRLWNAAQAVSCWHWQAPLSSLQPR